MSDNQRVLPYSNTGTKEDPILRSEYNAKNKMCPECLNSNAAERKEYIKNNILKRMVGVVGLGILLGPIGLAVGGGAGLGGYLYMPDEYTCKFCNASFLVRKWD